MGKLESMILWNDEYSQALQDPGTVEIAVEVGPSRQKPVALVTEGRAPYGRSNRQSSTNDVGAIASSLQIRESKAIACVSWIAGNYSEIVQVDRSEYPPCFFSVIGKR